MLVSVHDMGRKCTAKYWEGTHPTCVIVLNAVGTPGNVPFRSMVVSPANAATSRKDWISLRGSPLEEAPMPRRS